MPLIRAARGGEIRAVVVGAGLMGRWHAAELRHAGGSVVAVVDRERAVAQRLASRQPSARASDSLREALAATSPNVVHVCTPASTHAELVHEAVAAGAHVLVEKPLALDAETTEELLRAAQQRRVILCPVHQYPFQRGALQAPEQLEEMAPLLHIEALNCSAGGRSGVVPRLDQTADEILPHPLSVLQRLLVGGLEGVDWSATRPRSGELRATGASDTTTLSLCVSMNGRPPRNELRAIGERGTLHIDFFHGYALREPPRVSRAQKALQPFAFSLRRSAAAAENLGRRALQAEPAYPGLRELIRRLYRAIGSGAPAPITPADCLAVAEHRDRILAAAATDLGGRPRTARFEAGS